jgi:hypothetical protein
MIIQRRREPRKLALWTLNRKQPEKRKKVYRIPTFSKGRKERLKEYRKVRDAFMKAHPNCAAPQCLNPSSECHHTRGRAGPLLTDVRGFASVCPECHAFIGEHPRWARSVGLLCEVGLWNTPFK